MALNPLGGEKRVQQPAPVTLPAFTFIEPDLAAEANEAAARVAEQRTIRQGVECWRLIGKAGSITAWSAVGKALAIGREFSLRSSGANSPIGQLYAKAMCAWCRDHGFSDMAAGTRSWALELHTNIDAILSWHASLPDQQRNRLKKPQSIVRRWKKSTAQTETTARAHDRVKTASAAWRRFVALADAVPADQAMPLWRDVQAQAAARIAP